LKCPLARRLVEQSVRCVQIFSGGWDSHDYLELSFRRDAVIRSSTCGLAFEIKLHLI
jgi:hypothetical protein